jgi:hypothetical protein
MELDKGSASLIVTLSHGVITVTHGEDDVVLFEAPVVFGTWSNMFDAMKSCIENGRAQ